MLQLDLQLIGDALSGAGIELPAAEEESLPACDWSRQIVLVKKRKVYAQARAEQRENNENDHGLCKGFSTVYLVEITGAQMGLEVRGQLVGLEWSRGPGTRLPVRMSSLCAILLLQFRRMRTPRRVARKLV